MRRLGCDNCQGSLTIGFILVWWQKLVGDRGVVVLGEAANVGYGWAIEELWYWAKRQMLAMASRSISGCTGRSGKC